ncbi:ATP-binding protein [Candidatus Woesearchaeota archaeon]|nr:ATP-binding protein [Candidatus Woesearchaeota archaeon]
MKKEVTHNWLVHFFIAITILIFLINSIDSYAQTSIKIEPEQINKKVKLGNFVDIPIKITNNGNTPLSLRFAVEGDVARFTALEKSSASIEPGLDERIKLTVFGENITTLLGFFIISGNIEDKVPINVTVTDISAIPVEALLIEVEPITERAKIGDILKYRIGLQNLLTDKTYPVAIHSSIDKIEEDQSTYKFEKSFFTETDNVELATTTSIVKEFHMPDFIRPGEYVINVKAEYLGLTSSASKRFRVVEPILDYEVLGILPLRWVLFSSIFLLIGVAAFFVYRKKKAKAKRYVAKIDYNALPKPGPRSAYTGMIAETNKKAYFDLDQLQTHTLVAGSTGGGKTVSAEVLVEEALSKGAAVIVFDPTAQWTGFLRKNTDKRMFGLYPKFGMKKADAKAFNGNVRQILNAREIIDIKKFIKPGEINVFSVSKLDPEDIDILVANTVRQVFHANLPESPQLKLMIIFDEVHRLLPKFGGSGEGFIQIERAAREFRKWGVGLILISQVLTDFVGETKANINTEIQMRTRDQGDLDRIKNKYGAYMLQSLLKSATGTGMMENASYNKGNPYFVAFRPLLHEHARLSDEELDDYNKYNEVIDDLDYQLEQLEKEGIDVFDLKLELKMALDKVKSGSFNMVNIYLEGLTPRIKSNWDKLGKQPAKRALKLVTESELREELERAKQARKKFEEGQKAGGKAASFGKEEKILKFQNGIVVSKKNELLDALEAMDDKVFKQHVNEQKNDVSDWLSLTDKPLDEKLKGIKTKKEMIDILKKDMEEKGQI